MSEYRTTATLRANGTFVVPSPEMLPEGTEAEIVLRLPPPTSGVGRHPLTVLLDDLRRRPTNPEGRQWAEAAQASLCDLREEWD